jgi:hypothetical protein
VNPTHLFLGSAQDNSDDMVKKGRMSHGDKRKNAKLTEEQARQIKYGVDRIADLARRYSVTPGCISEIRRGNNWAWL